MAGMTMPEQAEHNHNAWSPRAKWAFAVFVVIGGFFLIVEHRAHVLPYLPWLLLAACPLMHLFMHGGHGGHRGSSGRDPSGAGSAGAPEAEAEGTWRGDRPPDGNNHQHHESQP
jgi:hypothetical protein